MGPRLTEVAAGSEGAASDWCWIGGEALSQSWIRLCIKPRN